MGVEDRLPGGLATAEEALLDPRMLDAALGAIGVPPLTALLGLASSRNLRPETVRSVIESVEKSFQASHLSERALQAALFR